MNNIKHLRKEQGMSVTALAAALNMSQGNLTKIENGQVELKPELAEKIAAVLQVSPTALSRLPKAPEGTYSLPLLNPEMLNMPPLSRLPLPGHFCQNLPQDVVLFVAEDDTMAPQISQGSLVLIDKNSHRFSQNGVYLLKIGKSLALRRLQRILNQNINILSDNISYPPEQMDEATLDIMGKAISAISYRYL